MLTGLLGAAIAAIAHRALLKLKHPIAAKIRAIVYGVDAGGGGGPDEPP